MDQDPPQRDSCDLGFGLSMFHMSASRPYSTFCKNFSKRFTCTLRFAEQRVKAVAPSEVKLDTHVVLQLPNRVIQRLEGCHELSRSALQTLELQQHRTAFAGLFALIAVTVTRVLCAIESKQRRSSRIRQTMACLRLFHALDYSKAWAHR